jgi:Ca-activated chloride channel family protein
MLGFRFSNFNEGNSKSPFDSMLDIFNELLVHTSGDVPEALSWLTELDKQYNITSPSYGIGDFINELKEKGYIKKDNEEGSFSITSKTEQSIRKSSLEQIFGKLKKSRKGNHKTTALATIMGPTINRMNLATCPKTLQ